MFSRVPVWAWYGVAVIFAILIYQRSRLQGEVKKVMNTIRKDASWNAAIESKAQKNNTSYEDQLYRDAKWVVKQNNAFSWLL